ncbi:MAG: helix-turn-helix domain-containing protein [Actinobacteria bacterium]|nr:helix-turn-helix domain-containing protein [Actinomycetota bacterium]
MEKSYKSFNLALKEILEKKKIKFRTLENRTNLSYTYFSKLKNRKKSPPIETIKIIASGLDIPAEYFLEFRLHKIYELLRENPELLEETSVFLEQLIEERNLKVAEKKTRFKKD